MTESTTVVKIEDKINQAMRLLREVREEQLKSEQSKPKCGWVDITERCTPVIWPSDKDAGMFYVRMYHGTDHVANQSPDGGWYGLRDMNPLYRVDRGSEKSSMRIMHWQEIEF